jgi:hypothetical protein
MEILSVKRKERYHVGSVVKMLRQIELAGAEEQAAARRRS